MVVLTLGLLISSALSFTVDKGFDKLRPHQKDRIELFLGLREDPNGDDYNRNLLEGITSLVFCSGWYVNQVSNLDPQLLGLCPLHVTLTHKAGVTTVLFNRPTAIAQGSPAVKVLKEAEDEVIQAIEAALNGK